LPLCRYCQAFYTIFPRKISQLEENDYYGRCAILLDGENLEVQFGPAKYPATLKHWDNGAFVMQFPRATQVHTRVTFTIGADGTADRFTHEEFGVFTRVQERSRT
jgi:hypothetical protein